MVPGMSDGENLGDYQEAHQFGGIHFRDQIGSIVVSTKPVLLTLKRDEDDDGRFRDVTYETYIANEDQSPVSDPGRETLTITRHSGDPRGNPRATKYAQLAHMKAVESVQSGTTHIRLITGALHSALNRLGMPWTDDTVIWPS